MKVIYPHKGVDKLCILFGKTRQAYYESHWCSQDRIMAEAIILKLVEEIRTKMKRIGTRKLFEMLIVPLQKHNISIGRDKLFDLLSDHGMLIRRRRRKAITTDSNHFFRKHPYLVKGMIPDAAEQIWVSDITYISLTEGFCYLSLITDAYSRKIMGYCLYPTLESIGPIRALTMAIENRTYSSVNLIHHSDRGIQYCCNDYIKILKSNDILISMTLNGDPYQNALAERINGILKDEFGLDKCFDDYHLVKQTVLEAVEVYNNIRPHASCDYFTPEIAHTKTGVLPKRWKQYPYRKRLQNKRMDNVVKRFIIEL